jgi:hypothetical protein
MEDVMLSHKRTLPLWQQRRRRLLALERALSPARGEADTDKTSSSERTVIAQKAIDRVKAEERWQAWLRGKI